MLRYYYIFRFALCLLAICVLLSCRKGTNEGKSTDVEAVVLNKFNNPISQKNKIILGIPVRVKYENKTNHLFVHDLAQKNVIELANQNKVIAEYGGEGRGPGELLAVENFFVSGEYIYVVDPTQYFINKYDRNGNVISSLDYGKILRKEPYAISEPRPPAFLDNNNEPFITLNGNVLLPTNSDSLSLYKLIDWEGNRLADIGEVPEEFDPSIGNEEIRNALSNQNVPARDLNLAFPVNDRANPGELFIIYSAIPKIAKYKVSGSKLWEREIPATPEIDSLVIDLQNSVESVRKIVPRLIKYVWGITGPKGNLYLATYTHTQLPTSRSMWIHQFDNNGKLIMRYKLNSGSEVIIPSTFDIDFEQRQIFVVTKGVGIRAYSF